MNEDHDLTDAKILRMKAEEKLKVKQNTKTSAPLENDVKRLVHELQVHQIELEMQNEELHLAWERAEAALKKYTMMYDFAPMGYLTLDQNAMIHELNFTAAEMLGDRRFSLINSNFKLFVSDETLPIFNDFLDTVYLGKSKEYCQVVLGNDPGHILDVYLEAIITGDDNLCLLSVVDISAFKNA